MAKNNHDDLEWQNEGVEPHVIRYLFDRSVATIVVALLSADEHPPIIPVLQELPETPLYLGDATAGAAGYAHWVAWRRGDRSGE